MHQTEIRERMQADLEAAGLDSAKYFWELWRCIICGFQHPKHDTVVFHIKHSHSRMDLAEVEREPMPVIGREAMPR